MPPGFEKVMTKEFEGSGDFCTLNYTGVLRKKFHEEIGYFTYRIR